MISFRATRKNTRLRGVNGMRIAWHLKFHGIINGLEKPSKSYSLGWLATWGLRAEYGRNGTLALADMERLSLEEVDRIYEEMVAKIKRHLKYRKRYRRRAKNDTVHIREKEVSPGTANIARA